MKITTVEKAAILKAKREVLLTKKLLALLNRSSVSTFFTTNPDRNWDGMDAWDAWSLWIPDLLNVKEKAIYDELYALKFFEIGDFFTQLQIDSNRLPGPGNIDGY